MYTLMINKDCYSLDLGTWPAGKKIKSHDDEKKNNYLYILYTNICIKVICINHGIQKGENITQYIYGITALPFDPILIYCPSQYFYLNLCNRRLYKRRAKVKEDAVCK